MSFDLNFVPRGGAAIPPASVLADWSKGHKHFKPNAGEANHQLSYENPTTGVYFSITRDNDSLALNVNYCRPTYFALECFEIVEDFANRFSLDTTDPQGSGEAQPFDRAALVASWKKGNGFACSAMRAVKKELVYMDESKATELWRFLRAYPRLKKNCDECFVPQPIVIRVGAEIARAAHLTRPCGYVWPPVDYFWLQNEQFVRAEAVLSVLGKYLSKPKMYGGFRGIDQDTCFETDIMDVWEAMYDSLAPVFTMKQVQGVALDGFVDVA